MNNQTVYKNKSVVIAFKFNDIFYSIQTKEWGSTSDKYLILIKTKNTRGIDFPYLHLFKEILTINYSSTTFGIITSLLKAAKTSFRKFNDSYVFSSNLNLIFVKYILSNIREKEIVQIEDGMMNYVQSTLSRNKNLKSRIERIFGLNNNLITKRYVLSTEDINSEIPHDKMSFSKISNPNKKLIELITSKRVFIGQNLYDYCELTPKQYSEVVASAIKQFKIDYYIQHLHARDEVIESPMINLNEYGCTLEMIAPFISNLKIYSINSSVLFTVKKINPSLKVFMVKHPVIEKYIYQHGKNITLFLESRVDKILQIQC